jgi:rhamnosyltransferase
LQSIHVQDIGDYELIIIDSSSTDDTIKIAKSFTKNIIIIPQNEFDHGGTRTKVAKIAKGELLIYLTQDVILYDKFTLSNILKSFDDDGIGAVYGRQIPYEETNIFGKHLRAFNYPDKSYMRDKNDISKFGIKTAQLSNSFCAYKKSILNEIGFFETNLILGEDVYVGAKMILAGYKLAYESKSIVYHSHSYTIWQEFKRYFDIGVFHKTQDWILKEFGKAEGEGLKYIKSELNYLFKYNYWYKVPEFFIRNGMKYLGYKLGQNYNKLPKNTIMKFSMHYRWWNKNTNLSGLNL